MLEEEDSRRRTWRLQRTNCVGGISKRPRTGQERGRGAAGAAGKLPTHRGKRRSEKRRKAKMRREDERRTLRPEDAA